MIVVLSLAARARRARHRAAGVLREPLVPAGVEPGVPRGARPHRHEPDARCRRASKACASCRRSAASGSFTERFHETNEDQYEANLETVRISAKYFPFIEFAGVVGTAVIIGYGGWLVDAGHRHRRHGRRVRALPQQPVRADPAAQPALQHRAVGGRRAAASSSACSTRGRRSRERPGAVDLPAAGRDRRRRTSRSRTAPTSRCCTTCRCTIARGRAARARRPDRRGQVDARQADRALLRPGRGRGAGRRRRPARRDAVARCASASSSCRRRASCSRARSATTCASAGRKRPTPRSTPRSRALGLLERFARVPRRARHRGARARLAAVGRGAAARVARARRARRPVGPRARRGDVEPRPRHRAPGRARARAAHATGRTVVVVAHRLSTAARADRIAVVVRRPARRARHPRRARRAATATTRASTARGRPTTPNPRRDSGSRSLRSPAPASSLRSRPRATPPMPRRSAVWSACRPAARTLHTRGGPVWSACRPSRTDAPDADDRSAAGGFAFHRFGVLERGVGVRLALQVGGHGIGETGRVGSFGVDGHRLRSARFLGIGHPFVVPRSGFGYGERVVADEVNSLTSGSNGSGGPVRRWAPTPNRKSSEPAKAISSNAASANHAGRRRSGRAGGDGASR